MRISTSLIIAGATLVGLVGLAPTVARELQTHTVTVRVPGGGVETIEYTGKIAPKISFEQIPVYGPVAAPLAAFTPMGFPSFAAFDRISAQMDRQMDMMMHQAQMLAVLPQDQAFSSAVLKAMPESATFSMISQTSSNGVCTQLTRITRSAGDAKPQVVSQTSGDCSSDSHSANSPASNIKQINYTAPGVPAVRHTL